MKIKALELIEMLESQEGGEIESLRMGLREYIHAKDIANVNYGV
jgi:hypothetical protein